MAKDINLASQEWCDIVFESKNKAYGAYEMRQSSSKRHLVALMIIVVFAVLIAVLPALVATVEGVIKKPTSGPLEGTIEVINDPLAEEMEKLEQLRQEPPPPPLKPTMQFIAPVMANAEDIDDENVLKDQETLQKSEIQISVFDEIGVDTEEAVDRADLERDRLLAEADDKIYVGVEEQPQFPGGERELLKYVRDNLRYPTISQENNIQGTVVVRFVVNKKGEVSGVEILQNRGADAACEKEAIRVVQSMPKWIAGKQNGVPVNVYFTLPIVYRLQN